MQSSTRAAALAAGSLFACFLAACGGGGGGGGGGAADGPVANPPPPAPAPLVAPAAPVPVANFSIKTLNLSWQAVPGAERYELMRDGDGLSGFTRWGPAVTNATSLTQELSTHLMNWPNARYRLDACNAAGCTSSATFFASATDQTNAIGYFKAGAVDSNDAYGLRTALSGDGRWMAVAAPYEDSQSAADPAANLVTSSGIVYVYRRQDNGQWSTDALLKAPFPAVNDQFGLSLAISHDGQYLVVGAPGESSGATGINGSDLDATSPAAGAAYVFARRNGAWTQQAFLKASNTEAGDFFGYSLALNAEGRILAVGAPQEASGANGVNGAQGNNLASEAGAVYLFSREGENWSQIAYVKSSNSGSGHVFGASLDLAGDGRTLAVGAPGEGSGATGVGGNQNGNTRPNSGAVYVFTEADGTWSQQAYVKASRAISGLVFGNTVALSGTGYSLAVGAWNDSSGATGFDGNQDDVSAPGSGAVYLFDLNEGVWSQSHYIKAANTSANDRFGFALALDQRGRMLVVSAPYEDSAAAGIGGNPDDESLSGAGAVYVFRRQGTEFSRVNYLKASPAQANGMFGVNLSLTSDGENLAVGTVDDSGSVGLGAGGNIGNRANDATVLDAGSVYLF